MSRPRLIVIGAGPVGLAAALGGVRRGWDVTVLESEEVGASLRRWGPTRFFSPLAMNLPPGARAILAGGLPPDDALLTGPKFVERILAPLARTAPLEGRVREKHRVVAVGRAGLTRGDFAGHPIRAERPFRVLVETPTGEQTFEAEAVLDASGVYRNPAAVGAGGLPAPGERHLGDALLRDLGALHALGPGLRDRRILLVGHGHSAANALGTLAALPERAPATRVVWATRSLHRRPCVEVSPDPLPERQAVAARANALAAEPPPWLRVERRASVLAFAPHPDGGWDVALSGGRSATVDAVVGLTGYRPDLSYLSELALEIAPATEGAARLAKALTHVTDCLSPPKLRPADLESGEPGFHLIGSKSYGRARTFLLESGYAQVETILDRLAGASA
ncbi:MAG: flavoprotein [Acidobacteria bacterium]|nr:flavoprotein [Acidobacteriota bacterium]